MSESKLSQEFSELKLEVRVMIAEQKAATESNLKTFAHISKFMSDMRTLVVDGNGKPGIVTRLDRIEQKEKLRDKIRTGGIFVVIGLVIKDLWAVLVGK